MSAWLFIGTSDLEEILVGGRSFGASSDPSRIFSGPLSQGKYVLFGVPVYDGTIGLGYRLPLQDGMTRSPFIFLRYIFTIQTIQVVSVFASMIIALFCANKAIFSWSKYANFNCYFLKLLITDIALIGPSISYLLIAEWPTQAAQYFGAILLISGFVHAEWFRNTSQNPLHARSIFLSLVFGLSFFLVGHPGNFPSYFFVIAAIGANALLRATQWVRGWKPAGLLITLTVIVVIPTFLDIYLEGKSQQGERVFAKGWYELGLNLRFVKQLLVGTFWPVLSPVFDKSDLMVKSGYEGFFGLAGIIGLLGCVVGLSKKDPVKKVLIGILIGVALGAAQMFNPYTLGFFQPSSLWQVRDPIFASIVIGISIVAVNTSAIRHKYERFIMKTLLIASALNLLYVPVLMSSHIAWEGNQEYSYVNQLTKNGNWKTILSSSGVNAGERIYLEHPALFRVNDWHGYRNFSQFAELNVASINSWPKIRDARTLNSGVNGYQNKFLNIIDSSYGCKPLEVEFLAVSHVLVRNNECKDEYDSVFGESGYTRKALVNPASWKKEDQVWLYSIKKFPNIYQFSGKQTEIVKCSLLSSNDCLDQLRIFSYGPHLSFSPFELCETECVFRFNFPLTKSNSKIVLPINFDKTIQVKLTSSEENLKTFSYNGFLAASIDAGSKASEQFEISIKPDVRMALNSLSAWLHSALMLVILLYGFCFARSSKR